MNRLSLGALLVLAACSSRPEVMDREIGTVTTHVLDHGFALVDYSAERVVVARPDDQGMLERSSVRVGKNVVNSALSADKRSVFVLSTGVLAPEKPEDEGASLTVVREDGSSTRIVLSTPLSGLSVDPKGRWLVVYPGSQNGAFLQNPNQLILIDLAAPVPAVYPRTVRSFGGKPQRLTFTQELSLPQERTSLLAIESEQDVTLLDLNHVVDGRPEVTVRLTSGQSARVVQPAGLIVDDGDPARNDDARIALRLANDNNVVVLTLGEPVKDSPNGFSPTVNLADVGAVPTDLAFVRTDGGARLAALVPARKKAVLIEPGTSATQEVDLPEAYRGMSIVTQDVAGDGATRDVALLYGGPRSVAFWQLGQTTGKPYRAIEAVAVGSGADTVQAVATPNSALRVLTSSDRSFYVLNLKERTASPLTSSQSARLYVAPSGTRIWAFADKNLAYLPIDGLAPSTLPLRERATEVFEVKTANSNVLVAMHGAGAMGVTILNANAPDVRKAKSTYGLLLEGLE